MHKNAMKCNKTQSKWCINKHGASKIIDTFETYHTAQAQLMQMMIQFIQASANNNNNKNPPPPPPPPPQPQVDRLA
jgi:hypothetical protein